MSSPFVWQSRIRFVDTDASGRIHYTAMFRHFEAAEAEFLRALDCSYATIETGDVAYPRVRVECDYLGPIVDDDILDTAVTIARVGRCSFTVGFLSTVAGRPGAKGQITIACMSLTTQRAHPLPAELAAKLSAAAVSIG
jgi:acyl-CoA thioester hydrolase